MHDSLSKEMIKKVVSNELKDIMRRGLTKAEPSNLISFGKIIPVGQGTYAFQKQLKEYLLEKSNCLEPKKKSCFAAWLGSLDEVQSAQARRQAAAALVGVEKETFDRIKGEPIIKALSDEIAIDYLHVHQENLLRFQFGESKELKESLMGLPAYFQNSIAQSAQGVRLNLEHEVELNLENGVVNAHHRCKRILPLSSSMSVYVCRADERLTEVLKDPCLACLEVANVPIDMWRAIAPQVAVKCYINGTEILMTSEAELDDETLKFEFDVDEFDTDEAHEVSISVSYRVDPNVPRYSMRLFEYFVVGGLRLKFSLLSREDNLELAGAEYMVCFDEAGVRVRQELKHENRARIQDEPSRPSIELICDPGFIVWPGSGVELFWARR